MLAAGLLAAGTVDPSTGAPARAGAAAVAEPAPAAPAQAPVASAAASPAPSVAASPPAVSPSPSPVVTTPPSPPRSVTTTGWQPYATVGPVVLHAPGEVVEVVGYHQSGNDGALPQSPVGGARSGRLEQRGRDTHPQGASDVVLDPEREVRAPVTGTVLRAGSYTLYCAYTDDYLVVEPDARPGWEVKMLHFEGVSVQPGDRVQAGVTVVGTRARPLPFVSQVDEHTAAPHWPHVHIEVVDPTVPDRPSGGGC